MWICSSGLLGPPSIDMTTPADLQKCFEANSLAPFFALKYAPPAMKKLASKGNYPNAAPKDQEYGSVIVVSSVASTYGGKWDAGPGEGRGVWRWGGVEWWMRGLIADCVAFEGCWGPCYTMSSHAALGVVQAGVAVLKGISLHFPFPPSPFPRIFPIHTSAQSTNPAPRLRRQNQLYLPRPNRRRRRPQRLRYARDEIAITALEFAICGGNSPSPCPSLSLPHFPAIQTPPSVA